MLELGLKFIETLSVSVATNRTPGMKGCRKQSQSLHCLDCISLCVCFSRWVYSFVYLSCSGFQFKKTKELYIYIIYIYILYIYIFFPHFFSRFIRLRNYKVQVSPKDSRKSGAQCRREQVIPLKSWAAKISGWDHTGKAWGAGCTLHTHTHTQLLPSHVRQLPSS